MADWQSEQRARGERLAAGSKFAAGKMVAPNDATALMDLPSVSRVTKLPLDTLKQLANTTPVFAPGLDHLLQVGAVAEVWDPEKPLDDQL
jgi:malonate decarboxylase gamma subunit